MNSTSDFNSANRINPSVTNREPNTSHFISTAVNRRTQTTHLASINPPPIGIHTTQPLSIHTPPATNAQRDSNEGPPPYPTHTQTLSFPPYYSTAPAETSVATNLHKAVPFDKRSLSDTVLHVSSSPSALHSNRIEAEAFMSNRGGQSPFRHAQVNIGGLNVGPSGHSPQSTSGLFSTAKRSRVPVVIFTLLLIIIIFAIDKATSRGNISDRSSVGVGGQFVAGAEQLLGGDPNKNPAPDNELAKREKALEMERIQKEKLLADSKAQVEVREGKVAEGNNAQQSPKDVPVGGVGAADKIADVIAVRDPNLVYYPNSREMEMNLGAGYDSRTDARYVDAHHLIIVPGHAVFKGLDYREWASTENWAFEPWQTNMVGVTEIMIQTYAQHIKRALITMLRSFEESKTATNEQRKQASLLNNQNLDREKRKGTGKESKSLPIPSRAVNEAVVNLDPKPHHHNDQKEEAIGGKGDEKPAANVPEQPILKADDQLNKKLDAADEEAAGGVKQLPKEGKRGEVNDDKRSGARNFAAQDAIPDQADIDPSHRAALRRHIKESIVLFSGGQSRIDSGPRSEGLSYYMLASAMNYWNLFDRLDLPSADEEAQRILPMKSGKVTGAAVQQNLLQIQENTEQKSKPNNGVTLPHVEAQVDASPYLSVDPKSARILAEQHIFVEEFARDSYENLLFGIARFYEITGKYPKKITVVGFEYKRERFETIHRHAIRFPVSDFNYIGIDYLEAAANVGITIPPLLEPDAFEALMAATATAPPSQAAGLWDSSAPSTQLIGTDVAAQGAPPKLKADFGAERMDNKKVVIDRDVAALAIIQQQGALVAPDVLASELKIKKEQAIAAKYLLTANDAKTIAYVRDDMYLCKANLNTRRNRNPQHRVEPYQRSAPHLIPLLKHCGPELFAGQLPWAYGGSD